MPEPSTDPTIQTNQGVSQTSSPNVDKPITRRDFLKGVGLVVAGAALASCDAKTGGVFSSEKSNFNSNIEELNNQFSQIESQYLNEQGYFNYDRFKTNPEFDMYTLLIDGYCNKFSEVSKINPNALKLITSSIVASNLGNWERIGENTSAQGVNKRLGPMQFYPVNALDTLSNKLKDNYNYTTQELEGILNFEVGLKHLVFGCLGEIKNDGENKNLIALSLAQYYGGSNLLSYIKANKEVEENDEERENYNLYKNTLTVMGIELNPSLSSKDQETSDVESNLEQIWKKATKEFWTDSNLEKAKQYFIEQAKNYSTEDYKKVLGLSEEETLALFIAISITESYGGTNRGPNKISGARGWFQVIPDAHLWQYNEAARKNNKPEYDIHQLLDDPKASTEVGTWALMRYAHAEEFLRERQKNEDFANIKVLMRFFKAGGLFNENWESGLWWNRVTYCLSNLLGKDSLNLGYMDYEYPEGKGFKAEEFLLKENEKHIGRMYIKEEGEES